MAVSVGNLLLLTGSVLAAVCAIFWPQMEQAYAHHAAAQGAGAAAGMKGKCPLGYEGTMPSHHPPIGADIKGAASTAMSKATTAQLVTYANANIWTANVMKPWAVNMTVDLNTGDVVGMGYPSSSSGRGGGSSSSSSSSSKTGRVVDMKGAFVMPGFVDPHVHLIPGGLFLSKVNLRELRGGRQEFAQRLAAAAASDSSSSSSSSGGDAGLSRWLLGIGWSESDWGGQLPDRNWIDEACGGRPAFLSRMDSHMALVNTAALKAAGLMQPPPPPAAEAEAEADGEDAESAAAVAAADAEGLIDRDPQTGLPTGLLRESAMYLVEKLVPTPSVADRAAALQAAGQYLLSHGVTSVGDMGWGLFGSGNITWEDLEQVYDVAAKEGTMPVRVSTYVPLRTWPRLASRVAAQGTSHPATSHPHFSRLLWGGVKEFADGSLGSSTALMWETYADAVDSSSSTSSTSSSHGHISGTRTIPTDELHKRVKRAVAAGLQVAVHAIGDRAVDEVVDAFEAALSSSSSGGKLQHRLEHVQHISSPKAATRIAALGIAGVPNPQHLLTDRPMLVSKLGFERAGPGRAFAYRTLADAGVRLGFGSDWPVVEIDPWTSVFAAVYRRDTPSSSSSSGSSSSSKNIDDSGADNVESSGGSSSDGGNSEALNVWESEREQLGLSEVLLSHTLDAAHVARLDRWVGQLTLGLKADFVVLDMDPFAQPGGSAGAGGAEYAEPDSSSRMGLLGGLPVVQQTYMDGACVYKCKGLAATADM